MKQKEVKIDNRILVVKQATMREILPYLGKEDANLGVELVKACTYENGTLVGDSVLDLGFGEFQKLMSVCNDVNGLSEGND